jgi:hypothetical protein
MHRKQALFDQKRSDKWLSNNEGKWAKKSKIPQLSVILSRRAPVRLLLGPSVAFWSSPSGRASSKRTVKLTSAVASELPLARSNANAQVKVSLPWAVLAADCGLRGVPLAITITRCSSRRPPACHQAASFPRPQADSSVFFAMASAPS